MSANEILTLWETGLAKLDWKVEPLATYREQTWRPLCDPRHWVGAHTYTLLRLPLKSRIRHTRVGR